MTSRERVRSTINHKEPDRVPLDLWGCASRLHDDLYFALMKHFDLKQAGDIIRPGTSTQYEDYALADLLGSDFRHINIGRAESYNSYVDEQGNTIDEWGIGRKIVGLYPFITLHPLQEADVGNLKRFKPPIPCDPGRIKGLGEKAKTYFEQGNKAITATTASSGQFFDIGQFLCGTEYFLSSLYLDPLFAETLIEMITDYLIELNLFFLEPIAQYIEWIEFTSDFGMQNGPLISPGLFRKYFLCPFKRLFSTVKKAHPHLKIFLHSCGAVYDLIPMFIEAGVEILNPLQPLANGMNTRRIKQEFGNDLVFHGAIDIQQAMYGSVEDIRREVHTRIHDLGEGGGYILSPANHLQPDIPIENIVALYAYAIESGVYPLNNKAN